MAKERIVNTRFWADSYVSNLDPTEKLLFLYLITNQYTEISGVYELPLKYMALDTGIEKEMVEKILKRFENDKKIKYFNGWVHVLNFSKYQKDNPKVKIGINHALKRVPKNILDSLCIDYDSLSHSNSNPNSNPNSNFNPNLEGDKKNIEEVEENKEEFKKEIIEYDNDFIEFWKIYDMDIQQDECFNQWQYIDVMNRALILKRVQNYIDSTDKDFRKEPLKYLRNKMWLDEVVKRKSGKQTTQRNTIQEFKPLKTY